MDDLRLHAVAARVVAWHNRHPLARRITAAQVFSVGYVALPYSVAGVTEPPLEAASPRQAPVATEGGGSLRERALARARHQGDAALPVLDAAVALPGPPKARALQPAFDEDFIAPLSPRQVARWARRQGRALAQAPAGAPLREVVATPLSSGRRPVTLFVLTAAIEVGTARQRVLLGGGDAAAVLGRRLWSAPRAAALSLGVLALALAVRLGVPMFAPDVPGLVAATPPAQVGAPHGEAAASAPELQIEVAQAEPAAQGAEPAAHESQPPAHAPKPPEHDAGPQLHVAALAPAPAAHPPGIEAAADAQEAEPTLSAPPIDVEPQLGRITLPALDLPVKDAAKAAAQQARRERAAALAAATPASAGLAPPQPTAAMAAGSAAAATLAAASPATARGAPAFAVSTRLLRTRAEAEQLAVAMTALLRDKDKELRVDVLPQGDDWRVVGWPFVAAAQADRARALLAARGMRVAVVDF